MTIKITQGDLLEQGVDAIVNTVNCVGVMGKGIALQFKRKWPTNFRAYEAACKAKTVVPGRMFVFDAGGLLKPRYIIDFIERGLVDLVDQIRKLNIRSIAIPPLGCGNGGLDWHVVRPLIERALSEVPDVEVRLFEPGDKQVVRELAGPNAAPKMTPGRAAMIAVLSAYRELSYPLSRIEVQKLAYFLERAGEPLGLAFVRHKYGPYSDKLRHVLTQMDGSYIAGVGDQSGPSEIRVLPDAYEAAHDFLEENGGATLERVERVAATIDGFQTPYGMELLATVHWVAAEGDPPKSLEELTQRVHAWNERKRGLMSAEDIEVAWNRLVEDHWIGSMAAS
jgi:O-acetyl-ADP-ribose deacetylase (regulator of RNase III)